MERSIGPFTRASARGEVPYADFASGRREKQGTEAWNRKDRMEPNRESDRKQNYNLQEVFRQGNPFNEFMTRVFDLAFLNVLWILCCIPVITIGASTTALYYTALKIVRNEDSGIAKMFFHSFRDNFRQSVPVTIMLLILAALFGAAFHQYGHGNSSSSALAYGITITIALLTDAVFSYFFPLLSHFSNTTRQTFRNAARLAVLHPGRTALMVLLNAVPFLIFLLFPEIFARIFVIWCVIGEGASAFVVCLLLDPVFAELEKDI